jgi:hypothetical protein
MALEIEKKDRIMNKAYKNSFATITLITLAVVIVASPALALPPDPDNAALLYYQAFLTLAQLSDEARGHIGDVARGDKPLDNQVRQDISKCTGAIGFAEAAAKVPACNWGIRYSQGFSALMPQMAQMRYLTFVLIADARIRAADGNYKGALERCLMAGTFARHIGDDTLISYLVSRSVRGVAYKCMQDVVGRAAGDVKLLQWLKDELAKSDVETLSPVRPLKMELDVVSDLMRIENVQKLAQVLAGLGGKASAADIAKGANEKTLERARRIYTERINSALTIMSTPMPYEQAQTQLKQLVTNLDPDDPSEATVQIFMPGLDKIFAQKVAIETHANAIKAAIEILLSLAKTGKLPDALPSGLPKDAFSGKDFEYAKTKEGFTLRCPGRDLDVYRYEFKLSK